MKAFVTHQSPIPRELFFIGKNPIGYSEKVFINYQVSVNNKVPTNIKYPLIIRYSLSSPVLIKTR